MEGKDAFKVSPVKRHTRLTREFIYLNDGWPKYEILISHLQLMRNKSEFLTEETTTITECIEYFIWV